MKEETNKSLWPGWETVRLIGRGSFGAVYEIERDNYGHKEKAALKVISIPQSASDIDDLVSDGYDEESITSRFEGYMQDIVREYSMMADMKGCANIVYCDDWKSIQHDDGMGWDIFIKMELLTALPRALDKNVTDEQVIKIGMDICNALAFCESRNLLHRDIKPQNIFVAPDGTYKLGDFGIAKTAERTTSGTKTGTYKYMAPEVYNNQPYGGKADIYSLGLVLYWLLNERRTPFLPLPPSTPTSTEEDKARSRRFSGEPIPFPAHGNEELKRVVLKACAFDPKDRYQSAEEMLEELSKLSIAEAEKIIEKTVAAARETTTETETVGLWKSKKNNSIEGKHTVEVLPRKEKNLPVPKDNQKNPRTNGADDETLGEFSNLEPEDFTVGAYDRVTTESREEQIQRKKQTSKNKWAWALVAVAAFALFLTIHSENNWKWKDGGITYSFHNGVLTIAGTGSISKEGSWRIPEGMAAKVSTLSVEQGITGIYSSAFAIYSSLSEVSIPKSVTRIGMFSFEGCKKLRALYYAGTEEEWHKMYIGSNAIPAQVEIFYNSH